MVRAQSCGKGSHRVVGRDQSYAAESVHDPCRPTSHWRASRRLYPALIQGGRVSKLVVWSAPGQEQGCDMAGRFTIYRDQSGRYRFCFSADNGQSIPSPETYCTEDEARKMVDSLRSNVSPRSRRTH
ncbi:DUF1508 domain-containing protein [Cryobacterium sp. TMT2-14]|nr:DUF1508 domain-containing protein [Cryobacterium sp. TMT2-14]